jgi:RNA polymerase sigma-70 factor (ECF subfamily)
VTEASERDAAAGVALPGGPGPANRHPAGTLAPAPVPAHGAQPAGGSPGTPGATDDGALVRRLRAGDEAAFVMLVERHGPALRRLARMHTADAIADEIVQETWIAVLQGIDRFEGRSALRTWVVRILMNIARSRAERERRHIPFSAFEDPDADAEPAVDPDRFRPAGDVFPGGWISFPERWDEQPEASFLSTEGVELARQAIAVLPPAQRAVVSLRDVEGWSSEEVAEALGISPGNERVLLHRGRSRVRAALEARIGEWRTSAGAGQ